MISFNLSLRQSRLSGIFMGTGQLDKGLKSLSAMLNRGFEGTVYFGVDDGNVNYQVQFRKTSCYRDSYGIFRVCNDLYSILTSIVDDSQLRKQISTISSDLPIRHPYLTYPLKLFSYAKWTDTSIGTCIDDGLIVITTFVAMPPDIRSVLICNSVWRKTLISIRPFSSQLRMSRSQIIESFPNSLSGTIWTAMAFCTIGYASFPLMSVLTDPKNSFI